MDLPGYTIVMLRLITRQSASRIKEILSFHGHLLVNTHGLADVCFGLPDSEVDSSKIATGHFNVSTIFTTLEFSL